MHTHTHTHTCTHTHTHTHTTHTHTNTHTHTHTHTTHTHTHQGIAFLDCILSIMERQKCDQPVISSEIQRWLELLLQLVDVTGNSPEQHLRLFLNGKQPVVRKYRHISQKFVRGPKKCQFTYVRTL